MVSVDVKHHVYLLHLVHCVDGGLPPSPGVNPGTRGARDVLGRPAHLQVGCHRAAVDEFGLVKLPVTGAKCAEHFLQLNRTWWRDIAPSRTQGLGTNTVHA